MPCHATQRVVLPLPTGQAAPSPHRPTPRPPPHTHTHPAARPSPVRWRPDARSAPPSATRAGPPARARPSRCCRRRRQPGPPRARARCRSPSGAWRRPHLFHQGWRWCWGGIHKRAAGRCRSREGVGTVPCRVKRHGAAAASHRHGICCTHQHGPKAGTRPEAGRVREDRGKGRRGRGGGVDHGHATGNDRRERTWDDEHAAGAPADAEASAHAQPGVNKVARGAHVLRATHKQQQQQQEGS